MSTLEFLKNPPVMWFLIGLAFALIELFVPGLILIFFGIGAWITALFSLFLPISVGMQIVLFVIASILSLVILRRWFKNRFFSEKKDQTQDPDDDFTGSFAVAETVIGPGQPGKISYPGSPWQAESEEAGAPGERVVIVAKKNITFIVKPIKNN